MIKDSQSQSREKLLGREKKSKDVGEHLKMTNYTTRRRETRGYQGKSQCNADQLENPARCMETAIGAWWVSTGFSQWAMNLKLQTRM